MKLSAGNIRNMLASVKFRLFYLPVPNLRTKIRNSRNHDFTCCLPWKQNSSKTVCHSKEEHLVRAFESKELRRTVEPMEEEGRTNTEKIT